MSHITGVTPRSEKNITMFMAVSHVGHKLCKPGDLVINTMWAWMAALGVARQAGIVSPSYAVYRSHRSSRLLGEYTDLLLRTAPPLPGVPFAMAARARRVAAECQPWVRHWRSYARTQRMKTRESERGGAAPKACSQTRCKLAKSKPSKTTFRPTPVFCGITERSLLCSIKSSLVRGFRVRSPLPAARPAAQGSADSKGV